MYVFIYRLYVQFLLVTIVFFNFCTRLPDLTLLKVLIRFRFQFKYVLNIQLVNSGDVHTTVSLTISFRLRSFIFKVHEINWVSATGNRRQTDSISVSLETYCEFCIRTYHGSTR